MSFVSPLALFALGILPVIIVLYMLRARRQRVEVSSLFLWEGLVRQAPERASWRIPITNPLLLMQLLIAAALALALARPLTVWLSGDQGAPARNVVLLVDASASMLATDEAPTRFEEAKKRARSVLAGLRPGDSAALVRMGARATQVGQGAETQSLERALSLLQAGDASVDIAGALKLAHALIDPEKTTELYIFSAGRFDRSTEIAFPASKLQFELIGKESYNRGITSLSVRPLADGSARCEAFATIDNLSSTPQSIEVSSSVDRSIVDLRRINLDPGRRYEHIFTVPPGGHLVEVFLDGQDLLPQDDRAMAFCLADRVLNVLLVSDTPDFLASAISSIRGVRMAKIPTTEYQPTIPAHLTVFEDYVPQTLPNTNVLFINPPADSPHFRAIGRLKRPSFTWSDQYSPLVQGVDLANLSIAEATVLEGPPWAEPVASSGRYPLILDGSLDGRQAIIFTFGIQKSSLPFRVAFPVLVANAVSYLDPVGLPAVIAPGHAIPLRRIPGAEIATVDLPGGGRETLRLNGNHPVYANTLDTGWYQVTYQGADRDAASREFAVNLLAVQQSNIRPQEGAPIALVDEGKTFEAQAPERNLWQYLLLGAIAMMGAEWLYFHLRRQG